MIVPMLSPQEVAAAEAAQNVTIMGAVLRPGLGAPEQCTSVSRALNWAGGSSPQADLRRAYVLRDRQMQSVDLWKLADGEEDPANDIALQANDILVVPFARTVMVVGAVGQPGELPHTQASTAGRALLLAGDAVEGGDLSGAYISRGQERVEVDLQGIVDGQGEDIALQPGDVLVVPAVSRETVFVAGAVQTPGSLARYFASTATQALQMAGGPLPMALVEDASGVVLGWLGEPDTGINVPERRPSARGLASAPRR